MRKVVDIVSDTDSFYYPVINNENKLIGAITLDGIRKTFATQELNDWLVALDITEPIITRVTADTKLSEALEITKRLDVTHIPVTVSDEDDEFAGVLDCRAVRRALSAEVLSRQRKADSVHRAAV